MANGDTPSNDNKTTKAHLPPPPSGDWVSVEDAAKQEGVNTDTPVDQMPAPPSGSWVQVDVGALRRGVRRTQNLAALTEERKFVNDPTNLDLSEGEQKWLWDRRQDLTPEQLENSRLIMGRNHPEQQGAFGDKNWYFDPQSGLPKVAKSGQKIPENAQIASIWGAVPVEGDDNAFDTLSKSMFNSLITVGQIPSNLLEIGTGLITDDETWATTFNENIKRATDGMKFALSKEATEPLVSQEAFESVSDFFNSENWSPSLDNTMMLAGSVIGSMAQFVGGAGWLKSGTSGAKKLGQAQRILSASQKGSRAANISKAFTNGAKAKQWLGMLGISSLISTNEALAEVEGVDDLTMREKMAFATMNSLAIAALELVGGGPEMRFLRGLKNSGVRETVRKTLLKEIKKNAGNLTGANLQSAYNKSFLTGLDVAKRIGKRAVMGSLKTSLKEAGEEMSQTIWQKGSEQVVDRIKGFQQGEGFGTDISSPESLQEIFTSGIAGYLGGRFAGLVLPNSGRAQNSIIFEHVRGGKTIELTKELDNLVSKGKITEEQRDDTESRISVYQEFFDNLQDLDLTETERKDLFHNLYNSRKLGIEVDKVEKTEGLSDEIKSVKLQDIRDRKKAFDKKADEIRRGVKPEKTTSDISEQEQEVVDELLGDDVQVPETQEEFFTDLQEGETVLVADDEGNIIPSIGALGLIKSVNLTDGNVTLEGVDGLVPFENIFPKTDANLKSITQVDEAPSKQPTQEEVNASGLLSGTQRDNLFALGFNKGEVDSMTPQTAQKILDSVDERGFSPSDIQELEERKAALVDISTRLDQANTIESFNFVDEVADPKELAISNFIGDINKISWLRFGDKSKLTGNIAKTYSFKKGGQGSSVDQIAKEASESAGVEITPEDVVAFTLKYPSGIGGPRSTSQNTFMGVNNPKSLAKEAKREIAQELGQEEFTDELGQQIDDDLLAVETDLDEALTNLEEFDPDEVISKEKEAEPKPPTANELALQQLSDELAREEGSEFRSEEAIEQLRAGIAALEGRVAKEQPATEGEAVEEITPAEDITEQLDAGVPIEDVINPEPVVEEDVVGDVEPTEIPLDAIEELMTQIEAGEILPNERIDGKLFGSILGENRGALGEEQYAAFKERLSRAVQNRQNEIDQRIDEAIEETSKGQEPGELPSDIDVDNDLLQQKRVREFLGKRLNVRADLDKVVNALRSSFPNIEAFTTKSAFDSALKDAGFTGTEQQKPLGFIFRGKVYIDPSRATAETPVHEFGHIWTLSTKESNPALYKEGIDLVKGTKYETFARALYPELTDEQVLEEALATAIGEKGANAFDKPSQTESFAEKFKAFLNKVFGGIRDLFGFTGVPAEQIRDAALSQYANSVVTAMLDVDPISTLSSKQLSVLQGVQKLHQQKVSAAELNRVAELSPTFVSKTVDSLKNLRQGTKDILNKVLVPISTRLTKKSPSIARLLDAFEFNLAQQMSSDIEVAQSYLSARAKSKMTSKQRDQVDYLLSKQEREAARSILKSFGISKEFDAMLEALDNIKDRAAQSGVDWDPLDNYFPRVIKDFKGMIKFLEQSEKFSPVFDALKAKEEEYRNHGLEMTQEERASFIDTLFRGYKSSVLNLATTGNERARKIDLTPELFQQFYHKGEDALPIYISRMNNIIEARKIFGRDKLQDAGKITKLQKQAISVKKKADAAIDDKTKNLRLQEFNSLVKEINELKISNADLGQIISVKLLEDLSHEKITESEMKEIQKLLLARFNQGTPNKLIRTFKGLAYIAAMGNIGSAIIQIGDVAFYSFKNGNMRTLESFSNSVINKSRVTKDDLGIKQVSAEFSSADRLSFWVNKIFQIVGLNKMDSIGKETFINATLDRLETQAKSPDQALLTELRSVLEENEIDEVVSDLQNKRITEKVKRVLFSQLSGVQPITPSEMPEQYLAFGNGKVFYQLQSFTIKQLDFYRREIFDGIAEGVKTNNKAMIVKGVRDLIHFSAVFVALGITADELKDLIFGRSNSFSDNVINNIYKLGGVNKYSVYNAKKKGIIAGGVDFIMPPFSFVDDMFRDAFTLGDDKGFRSSKYIPIAGKNMYYWFGRGAD